MTNVENQGIGKASPQPLGLPKSGSPYTTDGAFLDYMEQIAPSELHVPLAAPISTKHISLPIGPEATTPMLVTEQPYPAKGITLPPEPGEKTAEPFFEAALSPTPSGKDWPEPTISALLSVSTSDGPASGSGPVETQIQETGRTTQSLASIVPSALPFSESGVPSVAPLPSAPPPSLSVPSESAIPMMPSRAAHSMGLLPETPPGIIAPLKPSGQISTDSAPESSAAKAGTNTLPPTASQREPTAPGPQIHSASPVTAAMAYENAAETPLPLTADMNTKTPKKLPIDIAQPPPQSGSDASRGAQSQFSNPAQKSGGPPVSLPPTQQSAIQNDVGKRATPQPLSANEITARQAAPMQAQTFTPYRNAPTQSETGRPNAFFATEQTDFPEQAFSAASHFNTLLTVPAISQSLQPQALFAVPVPVPVGALMQQIKTHNTPGKPSSVEMTLSPEELGKVRLLMTPDNDQLRVVIQAERPETLELLRRNLESFTTDLRQSGYTTTSFSFGSWGHAPPKPPSLKHESTSKTTDTTKVKSIASTHYAAEQKTVGLDLRV